MKCKAFNFPKTTTTTPLLATLLYLIQILQAKKKRQLMYLARRVALYAIFHATKRYRILWAVNQIDILAR
jgi:hypothetical protein